MVEGLRERKRQERFQLIAETGLKLFIEFGYEGTTLEAIASASGISRRTFFYYFKSKDEILERLQGSGFHDEIRPTLLATPPGKEPLDAVRDCLLSLASRFETPQSLIIDRLLRSTDALRKQKHVIFGEMETVVFEALCEVWPQSEKREKLRAVAMVSVGMMRLGMEVWRQDDGRRPLAEYVREGFERLPTTL